MNRKAQRNAQRNAQRARSLHASSGKFSATTISRRTRWRGVRLSIEELESRCLPDASSLLVQLKLDSNIEPEQLLPAEASSVSLQATYLPGLYVVDGTDTELASLASELAREDAVAYAELSQTVSISLSPNDPRYTDGTLWGLNGAFGIRAGMAWDHTTGSTNVTVAVIDTGIDYRHPDLYKNIWINQGEIPSSVRTAIQSDPGWDIDSDGLITFWDLADPRNQGAGEITDLDGDGRITGADILQPSAQGGWANGISDDGLPLVDDLIGWNFVNNTNNPLDDHGHGTHVAGTIGAIGNNGVGVVGVNWQTQLMALKFLDANGSGSDFDAAQSVTYSKDHAARVSNNSWGGGGGTTLQNAVSGAISAGQIFVAAAGNDGTDNDVTPFFPASYANVVAVAATTFGGGLASFSNYGLTSVELGAPGSGIYSTLPGNTYGSLSGTSMASPHVAGVVALILSQHPTWTVSQVVNRLLSSTTPLSALAGKTVTGGMVNASLAVDGAQLTQIMDNGDTGFTTIGEWTLYPNQGYQADMHYSTAGVGNDVASWTFTVTPGRYRVSATWPAEPNRATNSPFSMYDGSALLGTVLVNQELAPNDFLDQGAYWENLGATFDVTGSTFVVKLTDLANQFVVADGMRIERLGDIPQAPEIQVLNGATDVPDNTGAVTFGTTQTGVPLSKTFTVKNVGTTPLTLQTPISVPSGFTVTSSFGTSTLAPGATTTFAVRLDAATVGNYSGMLSFGNDDADENPFNFTISGTVTAPPAVAIIDDGAAGFTTAGAWTAYGQGYLGDIHYSAAGVGNDVATWTFAVTTGQYRVAATWAPEPNRATNAPFFVYDGGTLIGSAIINQELAPNDFADQGANWKNLGGTFYLTGSSLVVKLTDAANEFVIADAIRIERIGDLPQGPEIQVLDGFSDVADNTGSVSFGSTTAGSPVSKTFTVKNVGTTVLTLVPPITAPAGFTVTSTFGTTSLVSGATTTFVVRLDAAAIGSFSGMLSFGTDDADENPFNFTISGTVTAVTIIDNGDAGFSTVGSWTAYAQGFQGDLHYSAAGVGNDVATWTFTVTPGQYRVAATWRQEPNRATNSPFTVYDGSAALATILVNQELAPNDFTDQGVGWKNLGGTYTITGTSLVVKLTDAANEYVIADAIRIERLSGGLALGLPAADALTAMPLRTAPQAPTTLTLDSVPMLATFVADEHPWFTVGEAVLPTMVVTTGHEAAWPSATSLEWTGGLDHVYIRLADNGAALDLFDTIDFARWFSSLEA